MRVPGAAGVWAGAPNLLLTVVFTLLKPPNPDSGNQDFRLREASREGVFRLRKGTFPGPGGLAPFWSLRGKMWHFWAPKIHSGFGSGRNYQEI